MRAATLFSVLLAVLLAVAIGTASVGPVMAKKASTDVGAAELKGSMAFFMTAEGNYIALAQTEEKNHVFFGAGRDLYRQRVLLSAIDDDDNLSVLIWAPGHPRDASIDSMGEEWFLRCGDRSSPLTRVDDDEREVLLGAARFHPQRFQRVPYALARNDRGEYFYVDRASGARGSEGFELYVGRTGKATRQKLKWAVSDSEGDVFASRRGELRITRDEAGQATITWKGRGKKAAAPLLGVPIGQNGYLIYKQLGVYQNRAFGTPCDSADSSDSSDTSGSGASGRGEAR